MVETAMVPMTGTRQVKPLRLRGKLTPTGLELPQDLSPEEWEALGPVLAWLHRASPWALADWLVFGRSKWRSGATFARAAEITNLSIKTMYNLKYMATEFPNRDGLRSPYLDLGHHEVLSGLPDTDKRRWLREGERIELESNGRLTVRYFREAVRRERSH